MQLKGNSNWSYFQQRTNRPTPSYPSTTAPRNKGEFKNQIPLNLKSSIAQSQGSMVYKEVMEILHMICVLGTIYECVVIAPLCFECIQAGHFGRECLRTSRVMAIMEIDPSHLQ